MFLQIGSITNIFNGPVKAGRASPIAALVIGGVTIAASVAVVPVLVSLSGVLLALASVLVAVAMIIGATGLTLGLPYAARQFRVGAEANRETMIAHGIQMGIAEHHQRQRARELPPAPIYVASSTGAVEIEASRR